MQNDSTCYQSVQHAESCFILPSMQVSSLTPLVQSITNAKMVSTLHRISCEKVHNGFRHSCEPKANRWLAHLVCAAPKLPVAAVIFTLPAQCGLCYNRSIVLCTPGARTPLDAQREAPVNQQKNVFSGTGIFQIISGLCYDTRQFVTFYTILPYRPQCSVTVGWPRFSLPGLPRSGQQRTNRLSGIAQTTGILRSTRS